MRKICGVSISRLRRMRTSIFKSMALVNMGDGIIGVDTQEDEDTKARYKFPYGDFEKVHRCGVLAAESRAGQYKYADIENAAAHLHGMIDAAKMHLASRACSKKILSSQRVSPASIKRWWCILFPFFPLLRALW